MPRLTTKYSGVLIKNNQHIIWLCIGILLTLLTAVALISPQFDYYTPILQRPTYLIVLLMCSAGAVYLLLITLLIQQTKRVVPSNKVKTTLTLLPLFLIGLLMRAVFIPSTPIYEDDFYRYFFDGSLTVNGINPYQYSPQQAINSPGRYDEILAIEIPEQKAEQALSFLADEPLMNRIAYPHISTIYPSVTQSVFALSYVLNPFNLTTWRLILLVFDIVSFFLLIQLLKHLKQPVIYSAIYWLNPLLITETINAAHMDILLIPVLLITLLLFIKQRYTLAGISLAVGVGIKVWPLLLIPAVFKPLRSQPKKLVMALIPCTVLLVILLLPQLLHYTNEQSGLQNYSQYWRTNSFVFGLLEDFLRYLDQTVAYYFGQPEAIARYIVATIIALLIAVLFFNKQVSYQCTKFSTEKLIQHWLIIIAALFFLSPTGYPWYFLWFLPLVVIKPNIPLLLLTMLLPLYDLRYVLNAIDKAHVFNQWVIPIEFLPSLICLAFIAYTAKQRRKIHG